MNNPECTPQPAEAGPEHIVRDYVNVHQGGHDVNRELPDWRLQLGRQQDIQEREHFSALWMGGDTGVWYQIIEGTAPPEKVWPFGSSSLHACRSRWQI